MSGCSEVTPDLLRTIPLPQPEGGDKNQRGRVLAVAGSVEVPGAALLSGLASLRAGAGKLQIATCARAATALGLAVPEALVYGVPETAGGGIDPESAELFRRANNVDAVLIGPGMADENAVAKLTSLLLDQAVGPSYVIDAAAMMRLRADAHLLRPHHGRVVITPHPGEMAGMLDVDREEVEADPMGIAGTVAAELNAVVVLKGAWTYIVAPTGEQFVSKVGNTGLATSGSGDVLAGIIAGLLGRGSLPLQAALWGVYLHGAAGNCLAKRVGPLGFLARELLDLVPGLMQELGGCIEAH